jgi:hypothetical protein
LVQVTQNIEELAFVIFGSLDKIPLELIGTYKQTILAKLTGIMLETDVLARIYAKGE